MRTLAVALLLVVTSAFAQPPVRHKDQGQHQNQDQLRFALILSRHGIRPPLTPNSRLDLLSSSPWPTWEVPPGYLTPHGAQAMQRMGSYLRLDLVHNGLLPDSGCPTSGEIYLYADMMERNIESTRNTFLGLEPGCPLPIHTMVPGPNASDPLFTAIPNNFPRPSQQAIEAGQRAYTGKDPATLDTLAANPELIEFAHILAPDPNHPAAKPILDTPHPLTVASSPIEDMELEYTNGKPTSQVGWGRVDLATLRRIMPLQIEHFGLGVRTPVLARARASDLMAHILDTLEQAAQSPSAAHPVPGAIGPVGARLVYLSGHDTNLYAVGGLLHWHWTADGLTDDTPPDSQIVFELWQNPQSKQYTVRVLYRAQALDQLRTLAAMTLQNPPAEVHLAPPGCHAGAACPFTAFDKATRRLLDPAYIQPILKPIQTVTTP